MSEKESFLKPQHNCDKWMRYENDIIKYYYPRIKRWFEQGMKDPTISFTASLGRDIARLIYDQSKKAQQELWDEIKIVKWDNAENCYVITYKSYNEIKTKFGLK